MKVSSTHCSAHNPLLCHKLLVLRDHTIYSTKFVVLTLVPGPPFSFPVDMLYLFSTSELEISGCSFSPFHSASSHSSYSIFNFIRRRLFGAYPSNVSSSLRS